MAQYFPIERIEDLDGCEFLNEKMEQPTGADRAHFKNDPSWPILTHASYSQKEQFLEKTLKPQKKSSPFSDPVFELLSLKQHVATLKEYLQNYMELFQQKSQTISKINKPSLTSLSSNQKSMEMNQRNFTVQENILNSLQEEKQINVLKRWDLSSCSALISQKIDCIPQISSQQKQLVLELIKNSDKAGKFLSLLLSGLLDQIVTPLLKLSVIACKQWVELKQRRLTEQELIQSGRKLIKERVLPISWKIFKGCKKTSVEQFSNYYIITFLFLLADFFVNPFFQIENQLTVPQFAQYESILYSNNKRMKRQEQPNESPRKIVKTEY